MKFLLGALSLMMSVSAFAMEDKAPCVGALGSDQQEASAEARDLDKYFADLAKTIDSGWTDRGFFGHGNGMPQLNPESYMYALKNGIMWWNIRIYFAKDLEDAKAHVVLEPETLMRGVYIIGADISEFEFKSDADADKASRKVKNETLFKVLERTNGFYDISEDGVVTHVPFDVIKDRLEVTDLVKGTADKYSFGRGFLGHAGWAATKKRGLLHYDKFKDSSAAKDMRKLARKLVSLGYQIKVNGDFETALKMARDQKRNVNVNGVKVRLENSRYMTSPVLYEAALAMNEKGLAYSVEFYRPDGKMVGGNINFVVGNLVTGDTIFHDLDETTYVDEDGQTQHIDDINFAKMSEVIAFDYLNALGVSLMDMGMASNYSKDFKTEVFPRSTYLAEVAKLPKEEVRLPFVLDPYQYPDPNFAELAKGAKVKGITKSLFLGGIVTRTAHAKAKALEHKLVPADLEIYSMKDTTEAEIHAKLNGYKDNVIYYIDSEKRPISNDLVAAVLKKGAVVVDEKTGKAKLIQAQRFKNILNPRLGQQHISWVSTAEEESYTVVRGWRPQ